jgi:virginiamycin B lyase
MGQTAAFPLPPVPSTPYGITAGPDGNLWFPEKDANLIVRMTPTGQIAAFPLPHPNTEPTSITAGPDGNLWFTEEVNFSYYCSVFVSGCTGEEMIGRITPT